MPLVAPPPDPMPALVIFDCDGVLVDSEPISMAILRELLAERGLALAEADAYRRFLGRSLSSIAADLAETDGVAIGPAELEVFRTRLYGRFRAELSPIRGIAAALDALQAPFCVASSSQPERIRLSLELTGLLARFEPNIFSASMVARGKPAPDLFLHAAAQMGVDPGRCLVIEDSPAGLAAANAAGMRAFGFVGGAHADSARLRPTLAAAAPVLVFDRMEELPGLLGAAADAALSASRPGGARS